MLLMAAALCLLASAVAADAGEKWDIAPGEETRIEAAWMGGKGYYLVYTPKDYDPERAWPVVFCYHGLNQKPTTFPFKKVTDGEGYVIVGMEYAGLGLEGYRRWAEDKKNVERVIPIVCRQLSVDRKRLFVGGFSKGGFYASLLLSADPRPWAGAVILGAGRDSRGGEPKTLRGKSLFIGAGEKETNHPHAKKAAEAFRALGAEVTFETFEGKGHAVDTKAPAFRQWMLDHGPLLQVRADMAAARETERAGKLGRAYTLYRAVAESGADGALRDTAAERAKALAGNAEAQLAKAAECVAGKQYAQAMRLLAPVARQYEGCELGAKAADELARLKSDPAIRAVVAQAELDAEADALEARAKAAEARKDYAQALRLYREYVGTCSKATRFAEVKAHLAALEADEKLMSAVRDAKASRECRGWLSMADNYIRAKMPHKAKPYLERIIKTHPDTAWAAKARERLAGIE
jgi:acetyl esterase/lipase